MQEMTYGLNEIPANSEITLRHAVKGIIIRNTEKPEVLLICTNKGDYKFVGGGVKNKVKMRMGYWSGHTMAMYPNQFAYLPIDVDFERIWTDRKEVNLYYHIPFCKSLCPYCGFFTTAQNDTEYMRKPLKTPFTPKCKSGTIEI